MISVLRPQKNSNGGRTVSLYGYVCINLGRGTDHPRAAKTGRVYEHILVAERALGYFLREPHQVHHVNEDRSDNRPCNLVICEDQSYHFILHIRQRIVNAGGDPNKQKICMRCHLMQVFDAFYPDRAGLGYAGCSRICRQCWANLRALRREARKHSARCECLDCSSGDFDPSQEGYPSRA